MYACLRSLPTSKIEAVLLRERWTALVYAAFLQALVLEVCRRTSLIKYLEADGQALEVVALVSSSFSLERTEGASLNESLRRALGEPFLILS